MYRDQSGNRIVKSRARAAATAIKARGGKTKARKETNANATLARISSNPARSKRPVRVMSHSLPTALICGHQTVIH